VVVAYKSIATGPTHGIVIETTQATDRQSDALVYELYGLTEEEMAIVEGG
jgi:hypothetical protein